MSGPGCTPAPHRGGFFGVVPDLSLDLVVCCHIKCVHGVRCAAFDSLKILALRVSCFHAQVILCAGDDYVA